MARTSTGFITRLLGNERATSILEFGAIELRSGPAPVSADAKAAGTLLARITRGGGPWQPGSAINGLQWVQSGRFLLPPQGQEWRLRGLATGVAGHIRIVANAPDAGELSLDAVRIDGDVLALGSGQPADFYMPSLDVTPSTDRRINAFWLTIN